MSFRPLTQDYIDAVTLPANIAPVSSPSAAIQRLLSKREKSHNAVVSFIKDEFRRHDLELEEEMRKESVRLLETLEKIKNEVKNETKVFNYEKEELVGLDPSIFRTLPLRVHEFDEKRFKIIDEHYEKLKALEMERSKRFKGVLNEAYRKMEKICHLLPYDLMQYFENEIVKLNEITMNNYRYYSKIQSDLKLQIQEDSRTFHLELTVAKERHRRALKWIKVKGVVGFYKPGHLTGMAVEDLNEPSFATGLPLTADDVGIWSKHIQKTLDELDSNSRKLINMYKAAVIHSFNRLFEQMKNVMNVLLEDEPASTILSDTTYLKDDMYKDIANDIAQTYQCDMADLKDLWNTVTIYMESNIQNTYFFLNGTSHLWDPHFARVQEFTQLVFQDLRLVIEKHDQAACSFDKKINTTLDKLREDSTIEKLNEHLREANKFTDSIGKLYYSQCDAEIQVLQKYQKFMDQEIDFLISEIDRFLSESGKNTNIREKRSSRLEDLKDESNEEVPVENPQDELIPHQMKACQFQVEAVNNWMFGLWEAIRRYMETCRKELTSQTNYWVETTSVKLKKRREVRQASHEPRYHRIKTAIYDARLKEINEHQEGLNRVEERIKKYLVDSSSFTYLCEENRVQIIQEYERFLRGIEEKLQRAKKSYEVAACIEQTKHVGDEVIKKIEGTFTENFKVLEENRKKIDKVICRFNASIKLFAEGGDYSRDEAKLFNKRILKIKKTVPKKYKKIMAEYNAMKNDTTQKFIKSQAAILARLDHSKVEFEHNEKICEKIKLLQNKIRRAAYDTKFKLHRIDACIDYYSEVSRFEIWKRKHFELMKDAIQECLQKIEEMTNILINAKNRDSGEYLNQLNDLIMDSFREIYRISKNFYGSHGPVINRDRIHDNVTSFMDEVKRNFDGFRTQVEIHCLDCVQELISFVVKLLNVNDEVYRYLLKKIPGLSKVEESEEESGEVSRQLSEESVVIEEKKKFLQGEAFDPAVKEVILKNRGRVRILHVTMMKLRNIIEDKVALMEEMVLEESEELEFSSPQ